MNNFLKNKSDIYTFQYFLKYKSDMYSSVSYRRARGMHRTWGYCRNWQPQSLSLLQNVRLLESLMLLRCLRQAQSLKVKQCPLSPPRTRSSPSSLSPWSLMPSAVQQRHKFLMDFDRVISIDVRRHKWIIFLKINLTYVYFSVFS